jgi:hypothetical protein
MNNGLQARVERLTEQLHPEPAELLTVVLLQFTPVEEGARLHDGFHRVGKYGIAAFMGGTEKERRKEVKRLRDSGAYDADPFTRAINDGDQGEHQAVSEGEEASGERYR